MERAIRYIRDNFSPGSRQYRTVEELNLQLKEWLYGVASDRPWVDDSNKTVDQVFQEERNLLLEVRPSFPFYEERFVRVTKKSMVQFDCNLYSVPPKFVGKILALRATSAHINIYDSMEDVARHKRCWSKQQKIVIPEHIELILKSSKASGPHQHRAQIVLRIPSGKALLKAWNVLEENLSKQSRSVKELVDIYGETAVEAAAQLAIENQTPRADSIAQILLNTQIEKLPIKAHFKRDDLGQYLPGNHDLSIYDLL